MEKKFKWREWDEREGSGENEKVNEVEVRKTNGRERKKGKWKKEVK